MFTGNEVNCVNIQSVEQFALTVDQIVARSAMSEETNADVSYLSCDINGTRYIYKLAHPSLMDITKDSSEEQNTVDVVREPELDNGEEPISLVCLNGQVYAIKNGVIEELNTNQAVGTNCHEKSLFISKNTENNENDYITNENIVIDSPYRQSQEQYEVPTEEAGKDLVAGDNNVNIDDFLEVVTAFKCKMCTYLSQDKMQLLGHIKKLHLNSAIDIKVSSDLHSDCNSRF